MWSIFTLALIVSALTTITGVLSGDKLLKTSHQTFQFVVQRDIHPRRAWSLHTSPCSGESASLASNIEKESIMSSTFLELQTLELLHSDLHSRAALRACRPWGLRYSILRLRTGNIAWPYPL
jgi:hypothetical protein